MTTETWKTWMVEMAGRSSPDGAETAGWLVDLVLVLDVEMATEPVTQRGRVERRILVRSKWYGLRTQPALLVRGSSRRITIVRHQSADIRVINRRISSSPCLPLCCPSALQTSKPPAPD
jgi:hypothetical protein